MEREDETTGSGAQDGKEPPEHNVDTVANEGTDGSSSPAADADSSDGGSTDRGVFCNQCGWKNPPGANFCSRCGAELQNVTSADVPEGTRPVAADLPGAPTPPDEATADEEESTAEDDAEQQAMGRQIALFVGGAVLVVVALFFVTLWSQSRDWSASESAADGPQARTQTPQGSGPAGGSGSAGTARGGGGQGTTDLNQLAAETGSEMASGLAQQVDSLRQIVENRSGPAKRATQRDLVNLYVGAGQTGRAAVLQQTIAQATDSLDAWRRAGDLLYRWMQQLQQQGQRQRAFPIAQATATAYETVSRRAPGDLQARTRMGEAYLLTDNPMKGIQTIDRVLADDSTFVPARFQKGLAFLQISRFEQAIAQFEAVKRFTSEGEPYYRQADRAIRIIRERTQSSSASGEGPASSTTPQ